MTAIPGTDANDELATAPTLTRDGPPMPAGRRRLAPYLTAGGLYLVASVGLWWHTWTGGASSVMTCSCTDAGRTVWYVEWSAFALTHGHNLLYSTWLNHPSGVNLLADTSVPAIGLVMAPVTLLFGPVASVNVAETLIPVAGALAMFWLLRRWVRWWPAAFVGGLFYGFSAFVTVQLAFGWLNLACTALLPLMVGCLDELLVRQRVRPAVAGAGLGLLVVAEFFVSVEILLIAMVSGAIALVVLVVYGAVHDSDDLRRRIRPAAAGLGVAAAVAAVLLAYPLWFFAAGPAHLNGMVWTTNVPGLLGNSVGNFWARYGTWGPLSSQYLVAAAKTGGGYQGAASPSPSYLGPGLLVVLALGTVWWRRDRRLWFFGSLGLVLAALSLWVSGHRWGPWSVLYHLPLFQDVVQYRFAGVISLCAAVMLGVIVDRSRSALSASPSRRRQPGSAAGGHHHRPATTWWATAVPLVVAVVALAPVAAVTAPNFPVAVQPVSVPQWFQGTAVHLPPGQVLLTYPFATSDSQSSIPWQAIDRMHYLMAGAGGPAGTLPRAGVSAPGFAVLRDASAPVYPAPALSTSNLNAVRAAMGNWGVTKVVVPDDTGLAIYQRARGTTYGVGFFTALLGSAPTHQDGAWVWSDPLQAPPPIPLSTTSFTACVGPTARGTPSPAQAIRCVERAPVDPSTPATRSEGP
jgi:hypothetical protein